MRNYHKKLTLTCEDEIVNTTNSENRLCFERAPLAEPELIEDDCQILTQNK